jgi:hypothetical protein
MRAALLLVLVFSAGLSAQDKGAAQQPIRTIREGLLDEIALYVDKLPSTADTAVVMRKFSGLDADLGTGSENGKQSRQVEAKTIKSEGPNVLAEQFAKTLKERGPFNNVSSLDADALPPDGALLIEGKFTKIDPGSRAKRYFVGFGAGKSTVAVTGTVKGGSGALLATFAQTRHGVMGVGGGDSLGKLLSDSRNIGVDIAEFLSAWARDKALK